MEREPGITQERLKKLPQYAQRFEMSLYQSAPSLEAYLDRTTLNTRLQQLANDIRKRRSQAEDEKVKTGYPKEEINNKDSTVPKEVTPQNNKESQEQREAKQFNTGEQVDTISSTKPAPQCQEITTGSISKIRIAITTDTGESATFSASLSDTVQSLKDQAHHKWGILPSLQRLSYKTKPDLKNECTLYDYNIQNGDRLQLFKRTAPKLEQKIQIIIKRMNGSTTTISMNPSNTIQSVKTKVYDVLGIPPREQRLIFAGVELADNRTLSSYNIQEGNTLHLVQRTRPNKSNPNMINIKAERAVIEEIDPYDRIRYVKTKINEVLGYSIDAQRLVLGDVELKDGYSVSDYNIKEGDELIIKGQVDIIFKDEDTGEEELVTADLDSSFIRVYSEYCQMKSIEKDHYRFYLRKAGNKAIHKAYARKSKSSVGSVGAEKLEISVKKFITEAEYANLEALMAEFCKISYMAEVLPFIDVLGQICREIHLRKYNNIQVIQSGVEASLSNCIGENPRLNSIARHLQDFFNSLWQEYMIPSEVPPQTSPLYPAFQKRGKVREGRLPKIASTVLSSQVMLKVSAALEQFVDMGGKADNLDKDAILGDVGNPTGDNAKFIISLWALITSMERKIEDERGEYTALELYEDVIKCCSNVFQDDNDISKKAKILQRLDRLLGKVFAPVYEVRCRGVNRSSIWGCCAAIIWARESKQKPFWPAIVIGM